MVDDDGIILDGLDWWRGCGCLGNRFDMVPFVCCLLRRLLYCWVLCLVLFSRAIAWRRISPAFPFLRLLLLLDLDDDGEPSQQEQDSYCPGNLHPPSFIIPANSDSLPSSDGCHWIGSIDLRAKIPSKSHNTPTNNNMPEEQVQIISGIGIRIPRSGRQTLEVVSRRLGLTEAKLQLEQQQQQ